CDSQGGWSRRRRGAAAGGLPGVLRGNGLRAGRPAVHALHADPGGRGEEGVIRRIGARSASKGSLYPCSRCGLRRKRTPNGGLVMPLTIEVEQEDDGRWIAEVPDLPGVLAYGQRREEAIDGVQALALRVLADRLEHGEPVPQMSSVFAVVP